MRFLKYVIIIFLSLNSFAVDFFNKDFTAQIEETGKKYHKKYNIDYKKNKIRVEILEPKVNKGEIYTYTDSEKYVYYPKLKQTVKQSYVNEDNDIILALKTLQKIDKTVVKDGRKYIVENKKIKRIESELYKIYFEYKNNKISSIKFVSDEEEINYIWKY
ncbi:hypothetical protein [Oceanivirga salmonicida]|uniref:hypothetical protein n=1 Tax=Oceanivirga salmonicida TaxID=1769291 RepID=UPI0012E24911|nr:hypothetical protein [Oceanivirga salmonicida]